MIDYLKQTGFEKEFAKDKQIVTFILGFLVFAFSIRVVCAAEGSLLGFRWQAGKRYVMSLETSKGLSIKNLPPEADHAVEHEKREFSIVAGESGQTKGFELAVECLSIKYGLNGDISYTLDSSTDPKKDAGIPIAADKRAFLGTKLKYVLAPDLKVVQVTGTDELVKKMLVHDPDLKGDTSTPFLTEAQLGTNALTELLQELIVAGLPGKYLNVGDHWTYRTEQRKESAVVEFKFTFAASERHLGHDCARIEIDGDIKSSSNRGNLPSEIPLPKVHGQVKGNLWLDKKLDMLVERTTVEEIQTEIEMPTADGKERSMPMTSNEKYTVTTKLIKVEDN